MPPTGPVAGDAVPPEPEAPGPAEAAGLISRFLPFDTAGLQAEVGEFLRAVEPVIPAIAERLTPLGWGLAAAALAAGAGVLLRPGRSLLRWRPWALVWPAAGRRPAGPGGASACPGRPGGAPAGCG